MKRSAELRELSVQHHSGLIEARRLRLAAASKEPLPEAVSLFLNAWAREIQPHFRLEEELLLPELARRLDPADPLIVRTLTEHVALRRAVRELARAAEEQQREVAGWIGQALDDHIRFEERVLFPAVEEALAGSLLESLGRELGSVSYCSIKNL
jgi:hemerythrin-like domain-containing protein